jgi:hypothetical protein
MTKNEFVLIIVLSLIVFAPMGWMSYSIYRLNQWMDKVDKESVLLDKRLKYPDTQQSQSGKK